MARKAARAGSLRLLRRVALACLLAPAALVLLFRFAPVPVTPLMLLRLAQGIGLHHDWVRLDAIAPALQRDVVASEDERFCLEPLGIDFGALAEQIAAWRHGETPRGASTITMQAARNLFLLPVRSLVRKAAELWLTPQIALLWPKRRVMEVYLNVIEFGPGLYGAQEAAEHLFHRPASALTEEQAALLAAVLPDPLNRRAAHPDRYLRWRAAEIRARAAGLGGYLGCLR